MEINGPTRVYALLGDPVAHSLSPAMQNAAFRALGLEAVYVPIRCEPDRVPGLIAALTEAGGGGNVTVPHKAAAARAVVPADGEPLAACNTFWARDGAAVGATTDSAGILAGLGRLEATTDRPWLVIGTGGSALAFLDAARTRGAAVAVRSRSTERAAAFLDRARAMGVEVAEPGGCGVVVNATPLGLSKHDRLPLEPDAAPEAGVALDLLYARGGTPWVRAMRAAGRRAADGREVLLAQGAGAFRHWFGIEAPLEVMRAALRRALD